MIRTKGLLRVLPVLILLTVVCAQPSFAQQQSSSEELKALRKEIEAIKESQAAIQKDLQEIKNLLQTRLAAQPGAAPRDIALDIGGAPFKGDKSGKLVLVEFSDYQCPFCARFVRETLPQVETDYIKTSKIKYVFRDLPIESIHPNAFKAAEAANCAGDQGKFWEMHDQLYAHQTALKPTDLPQYAQALGLDITKFQQCLDSGKHAASIRKDIAEGENAGVSGTPTFMLGVIDPKSSKVKVLKVLSGAQPYAVFKEALDSALSSQKQ